MKKHLFIPVSQNLENFKEALKINDFLKIIFYENTLYLFTLPPRLDQHNSVPRSFLSGVLEWKFGNIPGAFKNYLP